MTGEYLHPKNSFDLLADLGIRHFSSITKRQSPADAPIILIPAYHKSILKVLNTGGKR